jgi:two-component system, NtrC family, response regulator GlrR
MAGTERSTVLVVDDDAGMLEMMAIYLHAHGYRIRTAANGLEALADMKRNRPSALVVDLQMPLMNGAQLYDQLQRQPDGAAIPFILISGASNAVEVGRALGVTAVLAKPFDLFGLLTTLSAYCPCIA